MENQRMTIKEAAAYLRVTPATLYNYVMQAAIPFHRRPSAGKRRGGRIWFLRSEIEAWEDSGRKK